MKELVFVVVLLTMGVAAIFFMVEIIVSNTSHHCALVTDIHCARTGCRARLNNGFVVDMQSRRLVGEEVCESCTVGRFTGRRNCTGWN